MTVSPYPWTSLASSGSSNQIAAARTSVATHAFPFLAAIIMLFVVALTEALVMPVLRSLTIDRYNITPGLAHAFIYAKLLGMIGGAGLLRVFNLRKTGANLFVGAAIANGIILASIAMPVGFGATVVLRMLEGAASIYIYWILSSSVINSSAIKAPAQRSAVGATAFTLGLATGFGAGGLIGSHSTAHCVWLGAAIWWGLALITLIFLRRCCTFTEPTRINDPHEIRAMADRPVTRPVRLTRLTERLLLLTLVATVPLFLETTGHWSTAIVGALLAVTAMIAAFSLLAAGLMADRPGKGVLRLPVGVVLAGAVGSLPMAAATHIAVMGAVLTLAGVAAASLVKTSLETAREEGAIVGIGFLLLAVLCATGLLGMFGGTGAQNLAFAILPGAALLHLASLALALLFTRTKWAAAGFTARATEPPTMFATK